MYHGDSRPQDLATDAAMTALYRQLDSQDLPDDPGFDIEAGLRDLTSRIARRELVRPADATRSEAEDRDVHRAQSHQLARPAVKTRSLAGRGARRLAALEYDHERALAANSSRWSAIFFGGIAAMTVSTTTALIAAPHLATAVVIAVTVINTVFAAAGAFIHRTGTLARRTVAAARWRAPDGEPPPTASRTSSGGPVTGDERAGQVPPGPASIHIENFSGALTVTDRGSAGPRLRPRPYHRTVTAVLAVLTVAIIAAIAAGIAGMITQGPLTGYEITVIAPTVISTLLLITTWWWRTADSSSPASGGVPPKVPEQETR